MVVVEVGGVLVGEREREREGDRTSGRTEEKKKRTTNGTLADISAGMVRTAGSLEVSSGGGEVRKRRRQVDVAGAVTGRRVT